MNLASHSTCGPGERRDLAYMLTRNISCAFADATVDGELVTQCPLRRNHGYEHCQPWHPLQTRVLWRYYRYRTTTYHHYIGSR